MSADPFVVSLNALFLAPAALLGLVALMALVMLLAALVRPGPRGSRKINLQVPEQSIDA
jgi:hypothetical protein